MLVLLFGACTDAAAQSEQKKEKIIAESEEAKAAFIKADPEMAAHFEDAYGYLLFPSVGKGGLGVGGASGNGVAFEQGNMIGMAKLTQVSIGLQAGGQVYREVVFFENAEAMNTFKENKIELSAQASAVAAAEGASADAKYEEGVLVFTMPIKGLMYEASVGGQQFKFKP